MKPTQGIIIISGCVLILVGLGLWYLLDRPPTPAALAAKALSGRDLQVRQRAVLQLSAIKGSEILPHLRRLVRESQDPEVVSTAIRSLTFWNDQESLPLYFEALNHSAGPVREAAFDAIVKYYGGSKLPENLDYDWNDPPETRQKVIDKLKEFQAAEKKNADEEFEKSEKAKAALK